MEWTGEGLLIGVRRHGETSVIAEAMVLGRGRHLGLVRGGRSKKLAATLQAGNSVQLTWRARLEDHLGAFTLELVAARAAALIQDRRRLYASQLLCEHLHLLPERDPHDLLLAEALAVLDGSAEAGELGVELARFELTLLEELGFGLDLSSCAATGMTEDLTHVSPRSGRAVSRSAAEPYLDRLYRLPGFLISDAPAGPGDIADAFALTGHFLAQHVWSARGLRPPAVRDMLMPLITENAVVRATPDVAPL
jgi:DNA repair protein RecO (recombination protein O)